ncbi:MAG: prepilin-type N-terminal cleavage/methylation domain-containing protein [Candidatus Sungbacteria bacterium]|nr:prepilin-type N-terminal cleavage/methylation domain-containing protein [Candidatus Sungbacteria bacterium]
MRKTQKFNYGFTLLEMIISTGLFSVLVVSAIGIMLGVSNAQIKAANIQAIQDNIRFSLELITKEMRTGSNYQLTVKCSPPGSEISFTTSLGEPRTYFLDTDNKIIMRSVQNITSADCANPEKVAPLTSEEVLVDRLSFTLRGEAPGPADGQPRATLALKVRSRSAKYLLESSLDMQTTITQRLRDL